jgi:hypothetical protein
VDGLYGQNGGRLEDAHTIVLMDDKCRSTLNTGSVEILDRAMEGGNVTGKVTCTNIQDVTKDVQVYFVGLWHC